MCEIFLPCLVVAGGLAILLITFIAQEPPIRLENDYYGDL